MDPEAPRGIASAAAMSKRPAISIHRPRTPARHLAAAAAAIARLSKDPGSPFHRRPPSGFLRGIDFYSGHDLLHVMANAMRGFEAAHGHFPDLADPRRCQEKLFWRKFLGQVKVPESGDKLTHHRLIPDALRPVVRVPEVVWRSATPSLPDDDEIEPGWYFLKANHGSRFNAQVRFPLPPGQRAVLARLTARWLDAAYGIDDGEWWYGLVPRRIFLERSLSGGATIVTWEFVVVNGVLAGVNAVRRIGTAKNVAWMRPDFTLHDFQDPAVLAIVDPPPLADAARLRDIVLELARPFNFVRVDLHVVGGAIYLSEFTLSPANALSVLPPVVDELRTRLWRVLE